MTIIRRISVLVAAVALCASAAAQEGKLKIATVDMQQLFKEYHRTNEAQKEISLERARIQQDSNDRLVTIRELDGQLQTMRKQLEDPSIAQSKKVEVNTELSVKQQEATALERERREYVNRRTEKLNEKTMQRMRGLLEEIRKLIEEKAKAEDFDYVFDKSGLSTSQVPFFLYTKDATDMTAALLKELNKDAPAESAPAPAAEKPAGE